jgi:methylated-DNA-[protein]-cysteine S-methyltransferase
MLEVTEVGSPIGRLRIVAREGSVCALGFADAWERIEAWLTRRFGQEDRRRGPARAAVDALHGYFQGDLGALDKIGIDPGGTEFQRAVWFSIRTIPAGQTASYRELVSASGVSGGAVRAVGTATGANPVGIVVPCHRVVRADGHLGEYGGGSWRKRWLLEHEGSMR